MPSCLGGDLLGGERAVAPRRAVALDAAAACFLAVSTLA